MGLSKNDIIVVYTMLEEQMTLHEAVNHVRKNKNYSLWEKKKADLENTIETKIYKALRLWFKRNGQPHMLQNP